MEANLSKWPALDSMYSTSLLHEGGAYAEQSGHFSERQVKACLQILESNFNFLLLNRTTPPSATQPQEVICRRRIRKPAMWEVRFAVTGESYLRYRLVAPPCLTPGHDRLLSTFVPSAGCHYVIASVCHSPT